MTCCARVKKKNVVHNFALAVGRAIRYAIKNNKIMVDEKVRIQRLKICNDCNEKNEQTCNVCGCNLPLKTVLESESCPKALW